MRIFRWLWRGPRLTDTHPHTFRANRAEIILCPSPFLRRVLIRARSAPGTGPTMSIEAAPDSQQTTSNLRVSQFTALPTPQEMIAELPLDARGSEVVGRGRDEVRAIMDGVD